MLITELNLIVEAGNGGKGKVSFFSQDNIGPDGGSGGRGGGIYVMGTNNVFALAKYRNDKLIKAEDGKDGEIKKQNGADGEDILLRFPVGTIITIKQSGQQIRVKDEKTKVKIARGGAGGRGNYELRFSNPKNNYYEKGKNGTSMELDIELRLVADYGLIGLPNAGKSSLLNELTNANAKVADYPFTTIEPNIAKFGEKMIADLPGLIEGASEGKGLGFAFLKHIEKVGKLIHCVACDSEDIEKDYEVICKEMEKYNKVLAEKDKIILLTKTDMISEEEFLKIKKVMGKYGYPIYGISIHDWDKLREFEERLKNGK